MKTISVFTNAVFGGAFAAVIVIAAYSLAAYVAQQSAAAAALMIFPALILSLILCAKLVKMQKHIDAQSENKEEISLAVMRYSALILLAAQLGSVLLSDFTVRNDLDYICRMAENYLRYGTSGLYEGIDELHRDYLAIYPNNHALFLIVAGCYKLSLSLFGGISDFFPTVLNIAALQISYIFMCKCARLMYTPGRAAVCAVRGLLFLPLWAYAPFFYTDSLCMPFISAAAYLYLRYRKSGGRKGRTLFLILCAAVLAVGYGVKGSAVILLAAICADILISRPEKLRSILTLVLTFAAVSFVIGRISLNILDISDSELEHKKFPHIHWIMMSADSDGGYNEEDFIFTKGVDGYSEKAAADKERLCEKLAAQGISGYAAHLVKKLAYTWKDCTYMTGYYYKDSRLFTSNFFRIFSCVLHFTLLFMILRGFLSRIKNKDDCLCDNFFLKICLMGLLVFLLIWEARCRYLVSFFILFALI